MGKKTSVGEGHTSQVRRYIRDRYVRPAKREGRSTFRVRVGEVHKALGFSNRVPLVCNALSSRKFQEENSIRLVKRTGPPSGQSTTVEFTYELLDVKEIEVMEPLRALRGIGKQVFRELGGGEKFLRDERRSFRVSSVAGRKP
jgi:hypothetical protein